MRFYSIILFAVNPTCLGSGAAVELKNNMVDTLEKWAIGNRNEVCEDIYTGGVQTLLENVNEHCKASPDIPIYNNIYKLVYNMVGYLMAACVKGDSPEVGGKADECKAAEATKCLTKIVDGSIIGIGSPANNEFCTVLTTSKSCIKTNLESCSYNTFLRFDYMLNTIDRTLLDMKLCSNIPTPKAKCSKDEFDRCIFEMNEHVYAFTMGHMTLSNMCLKIFGKTGCVSSIRSDCSPIGKNILDNAYKLLEPMCEDDVAECTESTPIRCLERFSYNAFEALVYNTGKESTLCRKKQKHEVEKCFKKYEKKCDAEVTKRYSKSLEALTKLSDMICKDEVYDFGKVYENVECQSDELKYCAKHAMETMLFGMAFKDKAVSKLFVCSAYKNGKSCFEGKAKKCSDFLKFTVLRSMYPSEMMAKAMECPDTEEKPKCGKKELDKAKKCMKELSKEIKHKGKGKKRGKDICKHIEKKITEKSKCITDAVQECPYGKKRFFQYAISAIKYRCTEPDKKCYSSDATRCLSNYLKHTSTHLLALRSKKACKILKDRRYHKCLLKVRNTCDQSTFDSINRAFTRYEDFLKSICKGGQFLDTYSKEPMACKASLVSIAFNLIKLSSSIIPYLSWGKKITATFCKEYSSTFVSTKKLAIDANCSGKFQHDIAYMLYYLKTSFSASCESGTIIKSDKECTILKVGSCLMKEKENLKDSLMNGTLQTACATLQNATLCDTLTGKCCPTASYVIETAKTDFTQTYCEAKSLKCLQSKEAKCLETYIQDGFIYLNTQNSTSSNDVCSDARKTEVTKCLTTLETSCDKTTKTRYSTVVTVMQTLLKNSCVETPTIILPDKEAPECKAETAFKKIKHISKTIRKAVVMDKFFRQKTCIQFNKDRMEIEKMILSCSSGLLMKIYKYLSTLINITSKFECAVDYQIEGREEEDDDLVPPPPKPSCNHEGASTCIKDFTMNLKEAETGNNKICTDSRQEKFTKLKLCVNERVAGCDREKRLYLEKKVVASTYKYSKQCDKSICYESKNYKCITEVGDKILDAMMKGGYRIKHICSESYKLVKKIEKCFGKVGEDSFKCSQKPAEIANRFTAIKGQLVGDNSICNDDIPDTDEEESKECRFKEAEKYLKVFFSLFWKATVTDDSIIKSSICKVYYDIERKITMDIKECSGAVQFRFISVLAKKRKSLVASKICNDLPPVKENCTNEKVYSVCTKMVLDTKVDEETRCSRLTEAIDCVKKQMNNCPGEKQFIHYYFNGLFQGILRQCMKPEVKCDSTETLQCSKDYYSKFMKGIFAGKYNSELCRKFATTDSTKCMTKLKMYCENGPNKVKYVRMKRILEAIGTTKNEICQKYDAKTIEMGPGADECKFELLKAKIVEYFGRTFKASADNEETQKKFCRDYKAMLLNVVSESKKCSVYTQRILYIALHVVHAINKEACEDVTPKADEDTCQIDEAKQCLEELTKTATDVVIEDDMTAVCSSFNENLKCVVNKLAGCVKIAYVSVKNAMRIQESVFKEKVGTKCTVVPPVVTGEKCAQSAPMKCLIELEYARVNAYYSQRYETFCDKMKEKKECIDDEATACTADQETRKKMVLHHLEKCADNYCKTTIAKKEGCDYYTAKACVKTFSEGLTKNFVDGKDVCTDMAKMVSCIGENMKTCKGGYQSMIDRGVLGIIKCHKLKEKCPHVQYAPWLSSTCRLMAAKTCIGELEEKLENKKEAAVSLCPLMKSSKACLTVNIKDCPAYASKEIKIRFEAMERLMSKSCEKRFEVVVNVARLELNMGETKSFKFKVQESPSIPCKGKSSCIVRVIASEILTDSKRSYNYCKRYKRGIYWLAFGSHGKDITEENWKGEHEISVTSRNIGVRPSKPVNRMIEISYAVYLNGVRDSETVVKKIQVSVSSQYKIRPFCKAVGDPHYTTFDKAYYNNYKIGAFLLYENTESDSEVQTFLEPCARRASCNCAVSIRHRGNIFTVDACLKPSRRGKCFGKNRRRKKCRKPKRRPFNYKFFIEDKLAPGMKLYYGRDKLQVILPSGTSVTVKKTKWIMSVYVSAAPSDFRKTRGLCGWFNGNKANDLIMKDGSVIKLTRYPSRFHKEYKIPVRETMIYFPKKVKVVKKPPTRLCLVAKGKDAICGDDKATETCYIIQRGMKDKTKEFLKTSTKLRFEEKKEEQVKVPKEEETPNANNNNNNNNEGDAQTEQRERRRRAVEDDPVDLPEEHPNFNPISNDTDWTPPWTKALAEEACGDYLFQNEMYTKCALVANVPSNDLDLSTTLTQCVEDIQASGDLNASAIGALESMKASCQNAIDADPDFADTPAGAAIVTFMVANSCPGQCNLRGACEGGNCTCYPGWDGESCSVNMTEAPIPTNIGQDGICNPRVTNCREALVTASNIFNSDDLSCHVTLLKITTSAETVGSPVISKANFVTESQVICVLPTKNDSYSVSLSNNKINPGDSLLYLVFDPNCHECNAETPTCTKKAGICNLPSGDCMAPGESKVTDSCLYCDAKKNPYGYTLRQTDACLLKHNKIKRPTTLDTTDIIIIVVVCVCIVLGALGVVIYKHVKAKKAATKDKYSDVEPLELRNETPPPPPLPIEKTAVIEDPLY
ncbi:uncharacterized protein LOC141900431 isoform X2 [Tubulanus polymorphus]|uniref:uncharacterized protein LOC141900431 isoform X2 n=1 Tax=Tubulanus polymorphus TaxID=672921 RepID=UPI003DA2A136